MLIAQNFLAREQVVLAFHKMFPPVVFNFKLNFFSLIGLFSFLLSPIIGSFVLEVSSISDTGC